MGNFNVTIHIETSMHGPAVRKGAGEWLIEYIKKNGDTETRQGILVKEKTSENALSLELMAAAFEKLTKPCNVTVYTQCQHILNVMQNGWLAQWEKNDWKKAGGKEIKNLELWQQCRETMKPHAVGFTSGSHSYTNVMQAEIRKEIEK